MERERRKKGRKERKWKIKKKESQGKERKRWLEVTFLPFTEFIMPIFTFLLPIPLDCSRKSVFFPLHIFIYYATLRQPVSTVTILLYSELLWQIKLELSWIGKNKIISVQFSHSVMSDSL